MKKYWADWLCLFGMAILIGIPLLEILVDTSSERGHLEALQGKSKQQIVKILSLSGELRGWNKCLEASR